MSTDKDNKAKKTDKENLNKESTEAEKNKQNKLDLFEEDDLFEEFEEGNKMLFYKQLIFLENNDNKIHEIIDMDKFKEDWEDQEIADNFDQILKEELKL